MFWLLKRSAIPAVGLLALAAASPAVAQGCKPLNTLNTIKQSPDIAAGFTVTGQIAYYTLDTPNYSPSGNVPGVIEYCVYPSQPPGNPDLAAPDTRATYDSWVTEFAQVQGYFAFKRPQGNPTNIPLDGNSYTVGQATWSSAAAPGGAPPVQKIALHINNPAECNSLYEDGSSTCFVIPSTTVTPPVKGCPNGEVACKTVEITPLIDENDPHTVPAQTKLTIVYTYIIHNTSAGTMIFVPPTPSTKDINSGGGKDYFGCEQIPVVPASFSPPPKLNWQGSGFDLNFTAGAGKGCQQSRFTVVANSEGKQTLIPDEVRSFQITMETRKNASGKYEYTSTGCHILNSGFTLKWYWGDTNGNIISSLQSNSTNKVQISVDA